MSDATATDIVAALRQGTVPRDGLGLFATGLEAVMAQIETELDHVATGRGRSKWLRGDYGAGKTFTARHLCARARELGFATSEVQISVNDTPLHKLETVYRRLIERLQTATDPPSALSAIIDGWLYAVGDTVMQLTGLDETDPAFNDACEKRIEDELAELSSVNPAFAAVLRAVHRSQAQGDYATAQGLVAWLAGQPHTDRTVLKAAGVRGKVDGQAALTFLSGLLKLLRQSGYKGLVVVLDEVETIQRIPSNYRANALQALRQLMDLLSENHLPGLYLVVTGTPAFFDGPKGIRELAPLRDRIQTVFDDSGFDNLMAPQIRLRAFDAARLQKVGAAVRDLYPGPDRIAERVNDAFIADLVTKVTDGFGGQVSVVPRQFLRTLVDVLDRVKQYPTFEPRAHYKLDIREEDLTPVEKSARAAAESGSTSNEPDPTTPSRRRLDG